jgi:steroid 5-alpha reductase family enzyme
MGGRKRAYGFAVCTAAYVVAGIAAVGCALALGDAHPIVVAAVADALATVVVFGFSRVTNNSSIYDPYWSVAPLVILPYFAFGPWAASADRMRVLATLLVVFAWGIRLTYNWARRWRGLDDEDFRYVELRKKHGRRYWLVSFLGIHFFPTVLVFLGCLPLYYAATSPARFGVLDGLGVAIGIAAIWCEATADKQLRRFAQSPHEPKAILASGLWRHSRHPNYFGEILFWWAILAFGLGASPASVWTSVGALSITGLFKFVSVPLLDTRMLEKRPHYAEHMQRTNAIVPWPRRP